MREAARQAAREAARAAGRRSPATRAPALALCLATALGAGFGLGCGCGRGERAAARTPATPRGAPRAGSAAVAATVNGVPITLDEVQRQLGKDRDPRAALSTLVRAELLAQEARRRGLDRDPAVLEENRRALVRRFIETGFGDRYTKRDIPRSLVRKAYELNLSRFVHPELARVAHVLVAATKHDSPETHARARALAEKIARDAAAAVPLDEKRLKAIGEREKLASGGALEVRTEQLTTPRVGYTVEPFAAAAFALEKPGTTSGVVATSFGYHVVLLLGKIPAKNESLDEADPEIRDRIFDEAKADAFLDWVSDLEKKRGVRIEEGTLASALSPPSDPARPGGASTSGGGQPESGAR